MLGAIIGDMIGSVHEFSGTKTMDFPLFDNASTFTEDAVRRAISLGGDADTLACIAGGIAEAHYGSVPPEIAERGVALLDDRLLEVLSRFAKKYGTPSM